MPSRCRTRLAPALLPALVSALIPLAGRSPAQTIVHGSAAASAVELAPLVIVPQQRVYWCRVPAPSPAPPPPRVTIAAVATRIDIVEQVATTSIDLTLDNPSAQALEAELVVPVPAGVTVRTFGFQGGGVEATARLLPRDEARRIYESIVSRSRDPGLLEFAGLNLIRSSTFPVPPGSQQKVWIAYEQVLPADGERVDYVLPRGEALGGSTTAWTMTARIQSKRPIATVYSPTHDLVTQSRTPNEVSVQLSPAAARQPGALRLSYLLEKGGVTASLLAYPDAEIDGGYFLLLAGLPPRERAAAPPSQQRELILVLDRSGSMRGEKFEQARNAALQVLDGLDVGEAFNIVDYSNTVAQFAPQPVFKSDQTLADARAYLRGLQADGGTNIHSALQTAMQQTPTPGMLPMVLFLTDGLPTVGDTRETAIRDDTARANMHRRRIFAFGVGFDVNAPLLDQIALKTRGASLNVLPGENIEVAVSTVFRRLAGPVLALPKLVALDDAGTITTRMIRELQPDELPDLFDGDQLVVLGQYRGPGPLKLRLEGELNGQPRTYAFEFSLANATTANGFVPRLWASRKIANLVDAIRQLGEAPTLATNAPPAPRSPDDPRMKELVGEIVRFSTRFGILTEYTAFLATEGAAPAAANVPIRQDEAATVAADNLRERAIGDRAGKGAVSQSMNIKAQQSAGCVNWSNGMYDADMNAVEFDTVQMVCDQTLFKRGARWVDARLLTVKSAELPKPDAEVEFGSVAYFDLVDQLAHEGRNGLIALPGELYVCVAGKNILVRNPAPAE